MPEFHFDPTARLQRYLGRELIADPNLAIIEFVKNSYDAGASEVHVEFRLTGPLDNHEILISDNGVGMNADSFEANWMHPGYSYKAAGGTAPQVVAGTTAANRQRNRVPAGEKGLGRLAAGRLGQRLDVYTRETSDDPWLHVEFDWDAFDRMDIPMREVPVHYELGVAPPDQRFTAGTIIHIRGPLFNWSHRVRGRKVVGRADSRLGRLKQDLSLLMDPFTPEGTEFRIFMGVDRPDLTGHGGPVTPEEPTVRDYVWEFEIREQDGAITVHRTVRRAPRVVAKTGQPAISEVEVPQEPVEDEQEGDPGSLRAGPVRGAFYYAPPQLAARGEALGRAAGVYLYRDGIRVEPYGSPGDDWLGVQARKASRQGYAAIQPNQLTGYVEINRATNPDLIDMSNRNGLVENEAYDDLIARLRVEFRAFDEVVLEEVVRPNWEEPAARAQLAAQRAQAFAVALSRAATHALGQPVAALGAELEVVQAVAEGLDDPEARDQLYGVVRRSRAHLRSIDESLGRLMSLETVDLTQTFVEIDLDSVIDAAVEQVRPFADSVGIDIEKGPVPAVQVVSEATALTEALAELMRNGVEATRAADRTGSVSVSVLRGDRSVEVLVADEGGGVDPAVQDRLFDEMVSTSGRTGFGLLNVREMLALVSAQVELRSTGPEGSTFAIVLPSAGSIRKES